MEDLVIMLDVGISIMLLLRRIIIAIEDGFVGEISLKERKSMYELGFARHQKDGIAPLLDRNGNLNLLENKFAFLENL